MQVGDRGGSGRVVQVYRADEGVGMLSQDGHAVHEVVDVTADLTDRVQLGSPMQAPDNDDRGVALERRRRGALFECNEHLRGFAGRGVSPSKDDVSPA